MLLGHNNASSCFYLETEGVVNVSPQKVPRHFIQRSRIPYIESEITLSSLTLRGILLKLPKATFTNPENESLVAHAVTVTEDQPLSKTDPLERSGLELD